jgi:hypothetical protein
VSRRSTTLTSKAATAPASAAERSRSSPAQRRDRRARPRRPARLRASASPSSCASSAADDGELRDAGTWAPFARRDDITSPTSSRTCKTPRASTASERAGSARPHFALLLTFLELLGHAREQLNGLTGRHLDHYYRDVLQMRPEPATPDRASVVFRLAAGVSELRVPAGTALQAGRDSSGAAADLPHRARALMVSRARVDALRSVHVHRRVTAIPDVRKDRGLSPDEAFDAPSGSPSAPRDPAIRCRCGAASGRPRPRARPPRRSSLRPKAPLPRAPRAARPHGAGASPRDADADAEWAEINRLLGVQGPTDPRDLRRQPHPRRRPPRLRGRRPRPGRQPRRPLRAPRRPRGPRLHRPPPRRRRLRKFRALMAIKRRIDAEWAEINRILERLGARQRGLLAWELGAAQATDFTANLTQGARRRLAAAVAVGRRRHRLLRGHDPRARGPLRDERRAPHPPRRLRRRRRDPQRARLARARRPPRPTPTASATTPPGAPPSPPPAATEATCPAFDAVVGAALGQPGRSLPWEAAPRSSRPTSIGGQQALLDGFRAQLLDPAAPRRFTWSDVERVARARPAPHHRRPEPVARKIEWRNLHALERPRRARRGPRVAALETFGRCPPAPARPPARRGPRLRPLLPLARAVQGQRALTLTLGLRDLDQPALPPRSRPPPRAAQRQLRAPPWPPRSASRSAGANGPLELPLTNARLASGAPGDDYWTCSAPARPPRTAPRLQLVADPLAPARPDRPAAPTRRADPAPDPAPALGRRAPASGPPPSRPVRAARARRRAPPRRGRRPHRPPPAARGPPLDPAGRVEPFGRSPAVGARLYLSHPELVGPASTAAPRPRVDGPAREPPRSLPATTPGSPAPPTSRPASPDRPRPRRPASPTRPR